MVRLTPHMRQAVCFGFFMIILAVLVGVIGSLNSKKSKEKFQSTTTPVFCNGRTDLTFESDPATAAVLGSVPDLPAEAALMYSINAVLVETYVVALDLLKKTSLVRFTVWPLGDFLEDATKLDDEGKGALRYDMNFTIAGVGTYTFPRSRVAIRQEINLPVDGDLNAYPFDKWEYTKLKIEGVYRNTTVGSASNGTLLEPIPVISVTWGQLQDYASDFPDASNCITGPPGVNVPTTAFVQPEVRRTSTAKIYSMLITVMLWVLSVFVIGVAFVILVQGRKAEPPVIAFTAAILFAIPNVRNAQPGIPGIGCNLDVYAYFWNVTLCALALTLNLGNFFYYQYLLGRPSTPLAGPPATTTSTPANNHPAPLDTIVVSSSNQDEKRRSSDLTIRQ